MAIVKKSSLEAEQTKSVGEQMSSNRTQRDRNLAVKAELIKDGKHPKSTLAPNMSNKEKNLALKAELKKVDPKIIEAAKAEKAKVVSDKKIVNK